jgi:hypothetical protein
MTTNLFNSNKSHINSILDAILIIESTWETANSREPKIKLKPFLHQTKTTTYDVAEQKSKVHFSWKMGTSIFDTK